MSLKEVTKQRDNLLAALQAMYSATKGGLSDAESLKRTQAAEKLAKAAIEEALPFKGLYHESVVKEVKETKEPDLEDENYFMMVNSEITDFKDLTEEDMSYACTHIYGEDYGSLNTLTAEAISYACVRWYGVDIDKYNLDLACDDVYGKDHGKLTDEQIKKAFNVYFKKMTE